MLPDSMHSVLQSRLFLILTYLFSLPLPAKQLNQKEIAEIGELICSRSLHSPASTSEYYNGLIGALIGSVDGRFAHLKPANLPDEDTSSRSLFIETAEKILNHPDTEVGAEKLWENILTTYLKKTDLYASYTSPSDYARFLRRKSAGSSTIGMALKIEKGEFYCHPYPGLSADNAGIKPGDILQAVNGEKIKDLSLIKVATLVMGPAGTEVELMIRRIHGNTERVKVRRANARPPRIIVEEDVGGYFIRVHRIDSKALEELEHISKTIRQNRSVTLDFRGVEGGDLDASVALADAFLPKGEPIGQLTEHGEVRVFRSENTPMITFRSLTILQDSGTASASELIIAALIHSSKIKVSNRGEKTYGKAVVQQPCYLASGGYLVITTGRLTGPNKFKWDKEGISPRSKTKKAR